MYVLNIQILFFNFKKFDLTESAEMPEKFHKVFKDKQTSSLLHIF